jgi:phenylpropionate dioxygenase-like ring-hydroxylating dioxygenase large terminal subunit
MTDGLFDPALYADVRRPLEDACTLPPAAYHDAAFYAREVERVFRTGWNFIGHDGRVAAPGACVGFDVAGVPVLLVRGDDGRVRAFANTCRHRGAQLISGEATCRSVSCPYHGWTYDLAGRLIAVPGMDGARGFRPADNGLIALRLEQVGHLMWLSFTADAPPLAQSLGDLVDKLKPYSLDTLVLTRRTEYDVACNWKVYVENFLDYYHTPVVHRDTLARGNLSAYHRDLPAIEVGGGAYLELYARHPGSAALLPGAPAGFAELPGLSARARAGSSFLCVEPCGLIALTKDCVWFLEINPTGPETIRLTVGTCFHPDAVARPDFATVAAAYYDRWDRTVDEDNRINEIQ